ncbi:MULTISPECIES: phosphotransferase family protein [unclassified Nocardioides]|uniref:phosphotransferase family protein n=1 Tax=unclassified Nocardioides TaxID=2615069 RepID=UPI0009F026A0|nr:MULTISPECIES: phosphotransferase family protein [unclassified Nocardioides]GAW51582.1 aminoglycoside phosphotransferase [Nocardioides sp. PD653-B2]GAW54877.1 aminoglycoside phosphotransferase [Nocardioides sp. PD653]
MTQAPPPADMKMQRSSRDASTLPARLADWLATLLPEGANPVVTMHSGVDANGMSSETLILDAAWTRDGQQHLGRYVARVAPSPEDLPVFPNYALQEQYDAIKAVGELTDVPVPAVRWMEPTGEVLGTPFFLMDRIDGVVPQDVLPYNFGDNWLYDASPEDQRRLERASIDVLAQLHAIPDAATTFGFLEPDHPGSTLLAKNLARTRAWYDFAVSDIGRSPLVERGLDWLEAHLPDTDEAVLVWGDSRIGNMMYVDFEPVAVLDWEMAAIGPRELDVSWIVFAHQVFETITGMLELPGMPHFLVEADVVAAYEEIAGVELGDLHWYHVYNAVQWCIVFMRTGARQIHFGEIERPADIETLFHHKPLMERLLGEAGA